MTSLFKGCMSMYVKIKQLHFTTNDTRLLLLYIQQEVCFAAFVRSYWYWYRHWHWQRIVKTVQSIHHNFNVSETLPLYFVGLGWIHSVFDDNITCT